MSEVTPYKAHDEISQLLKLRATHQIDESDLIERLLQRETKAATAARLDEALKYPQPLYEQGMREGRAEMLRLAIDLIRVEPTHPVIKTAMVVLTDRLATLDTKAEEAS